MQTRRGGLFGIHAFKTTADNKRNCMSRFKSKKMQRKMCRDKMLAKYDYRSTGKMQRKKSIKKSKKMSFKMPFM